MRKANVEEALLFRAQQGNKEAFTQLIGQYRNDLYKIGKAILGNDCLPNVTGTVDDKRYR